MTSVYAGLTYKKLIYEIFFSFDIVIKTKIKLLLQDMNQGDLKYLILQENNLNVD